VAGRGYRLGCQLDLLDEQSLLAGLPGLARDRLRHLTLADEIDSTNEALLGVADLPAGRLDACLAEFQARGRGRRGREWVAPFGSGLCLSVSWRFPEAPSQLSALSLAAGVAVRRALAQHGVVDAMLKWPNDILHAGRKLGGILCELRAEVAGPAYVVIGVGINVTLPERVRRDIEASGLRPVALADLGLATLPSRSALAATLIGQLALVLVEFEQSGFGPFLDEWRAADALAARPVRLQHGEQLVDGIARGIDRDGALVLETGGRLERVVSGEVTVRPAA
jgi:BirA family biotin operon repressor/biotin-[acetyl-CoA-carboxylase] ligase